MNNVSYIYLECVPSHFVGKDGNTVNGYTNHILERVERGSRVYYNLLRKWSNTPAEFRMGDPVVCFFGSDGKMIKFIAV